MITVIMTAWRRFENLERIVDAWLDMPDVGEVMLWDNSVGRHEVDGLYELAAENRRLKVIRSSFNFGASARYGLADLAENDWLLYADDDYLPLNGIIGDLTKHPQSMLDVVGVKGRIFNHSYHDNTEIRGENLDQDGPAQEVDMLIGHIMLVHRDLMLPFSYRDAAWYCCELEWEARVREVYPGVKFFVVPSRAVEELPEASDANSLYRGAAADAEKKAVWERYYRGRCLVDRGNV